MNKKKDVLLSVGFSLISSAFIAEASLAACPSVPIEQASSGYGANGSYTSASLSFNNPESFIQKVYIYYPVGATPAPTIFFSHPYGGRNPSRYIEMIEHFNSLGYAVVYPQYPTLGSAENKYDVLWAGFEEAADSYSSYLDTSKVAFFGHSFGGGATPRMTLNGLAEGWGSNGAAMYIMAPWYSLRLSDTDLSNFDTDVTMNVVVFDDDSTNDHEMAIDIFENIAIPAAGKAFYKVYTDSESGCTLTADHGTPNNVDLDGLDYWNWYHMDALLDYTFNGNSSAQNIALGNGSTAQKYWGTWWTSNDYTEAQVSSDPLPSNASSFYTFECDDEDSNPRHENCDWPTTD